MSILAEWYFYKKNCFLFPLQTKMLSFAIFQVLPIAMFPEGEINQASHRLVNEHGNIPNSRILMQVKETNY